MNWVAVLILLLMGAGLIFVIELLTAEWNDYD